MEYPKYDYSNALISPTDAAAYCSNYITQHYPLGKQMTIERKGTEVEKLKMYQFIDACLDWSNGNHLCLKDLYNIQP